MVHLLWSLLFCSVWRRFLTFLFLILSVFQRHVYLVVEFVVRFCSVTVARMEIASAGRGIMTAMRQSGLR
jgi:hypothetical protein